MGNFNKEGQIKVQGSFSKSFAMKCFTTVTKILIQMPKNVPDKSVCPLQTVLEQSNVYGSGQSIHEKSPYHVLAHKIGYWRSQTSLCGLVLCWQSRLA
jgi:hypothetical protein